MNHTYLNGRYITPWVAQEYDGLWGVSVWDKNPATEVRRYFYETRTQARNAKFTDQISQNGRKA